ncbi:MBL fold metallo-hydrolase [Haladaptatus caseinilyticus]|uniref:MBL fold metallo-hydrolase n=1 Tax=Haladaptatus caseinilyticus TaxID=2993314 RepID=UPI00224ADED4|nr:MBL fold metallo-hydrolase [Haladaptatus caseinilyticus]
MEDALSARSLYDRLNRGESLTILDVRNRDEFEAWHIDAPRTVQTPYAEFMSAKVTDEIPTLADSLALESPVVAVCPRGEASERVAEMLRDAGIDAKNLADGMNGWARVYVAREIDGGSGQDDATILQYERPSSGCLSYLVISDGEAAVIDPLREFADRYVEDTRAQGAALRYAIDTHVHADHVSGLREVASATDAEMILPDGARDRGLALEAAFVQDGDEIEVGTAALTAIYAPGHTSEMMLFRLGNTLFSADTLFLDSIGRPDLEGGTSDEVASDGSDRAVDLASDLYETLHEHVLSLPDGTVVAPGHVHEKTRRRGDDTFTARLPTVRDSIPLLSVGRDEFVARVASDLPPRPANYEEIVMVNLGRKTVEDAAAFELELGPNNCAVQ